ncbi:hypothetical protein N0V85_005398, partial [Neurospora sp. IMI 360204]
MPPYDAHCPWDSGDGNTGSEDESTTSEDSDTSEHHTIPYIKVEPEDEGPPHSLSDSSSSSDSEDENNQPPVRIAQLFKGKARTRSKSPVSEIGSDELDVSNQLRRENLELRNDLSKLQQQIRGVTQDRHDAETMLEEKMREVEELNKQIMSSSNNSALVHDGSSTAQKANGKRSQETGTASQIRELLATLQARENQHQEQLRQLTKQLEQKEDQYVARLRELRLGNRLAPDVNQSVSSSHDCTPVREEKDDKIQETKSDREIGRLNALFQAKEKQYQQQLRQLTKQLEQKEDQYVARLRELRLSNSLAPDINKLRADLAAESQAKENAYVERIRQLSIEHAAKEDQLKSGLGALSSALHREEFQHQKHANQLKAERQKVQERCNNLQAELDGAITSFSKEVSELKSRDPFESVRKSDAEIQATWKDLAIRVRQFVQTYCLAVIPHATAQELYKKKLLPGIQTICADPPAVLVNPQLCSSLLQGLIWEVLWTFVFSSRAEGWAGKAGQDFGEAYERASAHVKSLPKDVNWASTVAALHSWKARSFTFLKQLRPIFHADIAALTYFLASLLDPITTPTAL